MNDEYTRENRIRKYNLKLKAEAVALTSYSIIVALFVFMVGSSSYADLTKVALSILLLFVMVVLSKRFKKMDSEIDDIFTN